MVEQKKEDLFAVVGAGAQSYVPVKKKRSFRERIKGKPVFSAALLLLIVLGCVFAPVFANHDPAGFYLDACNVPPGAEFYFEAKYFARKDRRWISHTPS